MKLLLLIFILCSIKLTVIAGDIELGKVNWMRDLKEAQLASRKSNKPILILFQEVPGCATCRNYGTNVLSHPLIVEAIETHFIPLCIHNNKSGKDREALELFSEPRWNNPVVRIVDGNLKPIVDRISGNYSSYGLLTRINASLMKLGIKVPEYMNLLEEEFRGHQAGLQSATIGMYCFWSGEKTYGNAKGVIATKAGFMNGAEVVEIKYNPNVTNLNELINTGKGNNCADKLYADHGMNMNTGIPISKPGSFRIDPETKYYLYKSDYKYIPMTELQAARANSLLGEGKPCESVLSPRQLALFQKQKTIPKSKLKNQIGREMSVAWYEGK